MRLGYQDSTLEFLSNRGHFSRMNWAETYSLPIVVGLSFNDRGTSGCHHT